MPEPHITSGYFLIGQKDNLTMLLKHKMTTNDFIINQIYAQINVEYLKNTSNIQFGVKLGKHIISDNKFCLNNEM